jgi:hypothetical protein
LWGRDTCLLGLGLRPIARGDRPSRLEAWLCGVGALTVTGVGALTVTGVGALTVTGVGAPKVSAGVDPGVGVGVDGTGLETSRWDP